MSIEERVRDTLQRQAATVELSPDGWDRIRERAERRHRWPPIATAVTAATLVAVAAVVVSVNSGDRPQRVATGPAAGPNEPTAPTAPVTTMPSTASLVGAQLRIDGLGPVAIGMSFEEARRLAGVPLTLNDGPYCDALRPEGALSGVSLTDTDESPGAPRIDLIFVTSPSVATLSGIRVGSSADDVRQAYGGSLETRGDDGSGRYWLLYRASDPALRDYGLRLDISNGRVSRMVAGLGVVTDEFCA
jgi:hypothetical protein